MDTTQQPPPAPEGDVHEDLAALKAADPADAPELAAKVADVLTYELEQTADPETLDPLVKEDPV